MTLLPSAMFAGRWQQGHGHLQDHLPSHQPSHLPCHPPCHLPCHSAQACDSRCSLSAMAFSFIALSRSWAMSWLPPLEMACMAFFRSMGLASSSWVQGLGHQGRQCSSQVSGSGRTRETMQQPRAECGSDVQRKRREVRKQGQLPLGQSKQAME